MYLLFKSLLSAVEQREKLNFSILNWNKNFYKCSAVAFVVYFYEIYVPRYRNVLLRIWCFTIWWMTVSLTSYQIPILYLRRRLSEGANQGCDNDKFVFSVDIDFIMMFISLIATLKTNFLHLLFLRRNWFPPNFHTIVTKF